MAGISPTSQRFLHRDGFSQPSPSSRGTMSSSRQPNLEDIPLEKVVTSGSATGARKPTSSLNHTTAVGSRNGSFQAHRGPRPRVGRRKTTGDTMDGIKPPKNDDGTLTRMGKIYQAILNFSVITRYFIYVLPLAAILSVPIVLGYTIAKDATIAGITMAWFFIWLEVGKLDTEI